MCAVVVFVGMITNKLVNQNHFDVIFLRFPRVFILSGGMGFSFHSGKIHHIKKLNDFLFCMGEGIKKEFVF